MLYDASAPGGHSGHLHVGCPLQHNSLHLRRTRLPLTTFEFFLHLFKLSFQVFIIVAYFCVVSLFSLCFYPTVCFVFFPDFFFFNYSINCHVNIRFIAKEIEYYWYGSLKFASLPQRGLMIYFLSLFLEQQHMQR